MVCDTSQKVVSIPRRRTARGAAVMPVGGWPHGDDCDRIRRPRAVRVGRLLCCGDRTVYANLAARRAPCGWAVPRVCESWPAGSRETSPSPSPAPHGWPPCGSRVACLGNKPVAELETTFALEGEPVDARVADDQARRTLDHRLLREGKLIGSDRHLVEPAVGRIGRENPVRESHELFVANSSTNRARSGSRGRRISRRGVSMVGVERARTRSRVSSSLSCLGLLGRFPASVTGPITYERRCETLSAVEGDAR